MSDEPVCGDPEGAFSLTPQQRAALELDANIAITAGAGTGKTTTLTERYRSILASADDVSPTEILTLTFTKDATSELQDQIRAVVDEELAAADASAYARWRGVKDDIEDAYIHTIHGFCSRLLREFAVEAGVHPEFETLDEGEADAVIDEAITTVLEWYGVADGETAGREPLADLEADPERELQREIRILTRVYSRSNLEAALAGLFDERPDSVEWARRCAEQTPETYLSWLADCIEIPITRDEANALIETERAQAAIDDLLAVGALDLGIDSAVDDGAALLARLTGILDETGAHLPDGDGVDRQRFLLAVADGVTSNDGTWQSQTWRYAGSGGRWSDHGRSDEQDRFRSAVETLGELVEPESRELGYDPLVARAEAGQVLALARLFRCVKAEYEALKTRRNALDYADLIGTATAFLDANEPARRTLRDQFAYIMLDEVQDTDPRQWQLIKLLSGDDPDRFDGGNVFLVGDEKQSIYRFRDADVTRFREAREQLLADAPPASAESDAGDLELSGNFRTLEGPLSVINELFGRVLQPAADGPPAEESDSDAGQYRPYEATPQRLSACRTDGTDIEGSVEYLLVPGDEDADEALGLADSWFTDAPFVSRAEREATAIAARLTQLFDTARIYDPDEEAYTTARPRDVALLFQSSRRVAAFERAFEAAGIPHTNLAGSSFYDTPEIRPLINLLRVLEDPTADVPLYGVLRSPLFGFEDATIARARDPETPLWDSLSGATPELQAARKQLETWRTAVGLGETVDVHHWSALLSRVIDETGYLIGVGADERSHQAVANVEQFRAQLRNWEEASARSVSALLDRVRRDRETDVDPSDATVPGEIDGVQLRTIHSAKGLEFPIVVLPELTRAFNLQSSLPGAHFERLDGAPVVGMKAPASKAAYETTNTTAYRAVREQYWRRERAEKRRLLYVAATRTRDRLVLSGTHGTDPDTESGLEAAGEWAEANSWQSWVQPILLDEPGLVGTLAETATVDGTVGDAPYSIRRPTPPVDWTPEPTADAVPSDIEIPEPPRRPSRRRLSATQFRDLIDEAQTRPDLLRATADDGTAAHSSIDDTAAIETLGKATVGTIVHRLCELQPPTAAWPTVIRRHVDDPETVDAAVLEAITAHAEAGVAGLRQLESGHRIRSRHAELPVTLELDRLEVRGDIDHLSATEDGYLIVDYKTSDLSTQSLGHLIERYFLQLVAYAGALSQADDTATEFEIGLVFTDIGVCRSRTLTRDDVDALLAWAQRAIQRT
jgi:ATP-dependent helicase/nuclease subunit A